MIVAKFIVLLLQKKEDGMKRTVLGVTAVTLAAWLLSPALGLATGEFAKKEGGAPCTKCHVKPMKGDENLNAAGKCYKAQEKKDLKACEAKK